MKLPLWKRFCLWFCKPYYGYDSGLDGTCVVKAKKLFGIIYVTDIKHCDKGE